MITLRAPQRTEPKPRPKARPDLRVIESPPVSPDRETGSRDRARRQGGLVGTLFVVLLFVCIFGVVVFQVFLVQTQSHLDDLGSQLSREHNRTKALRLDTADLESPDRIVQDARDRLGMIPPPEIAYLQPGAGDDAAAAFDPAKEVPPTTATTAVTAPKTPPATSKASTTPTTAAKATTPTTAKGAKTTPTTAKPVPTTAKPTTTTTTKPKPTTTTTRPKATSTPTTTTKATPSR